MCAAYSGCRQLENVELVACSQLATLTLKPLAAADHPKSAATQMFDLKPIFPPTKNQPRQVRKFELNSIFSKKIESGKDRLDLWSFYGWAQVDIGEFWRKSILGGFGTKSYLWVFPVHVDLVGFSGPTPVDFFECWTLDRPKQMSVWTMDD